MSGWRWPVLFLRLDTGPMGHYSQWESIRATQSGRRRTEVEEMAFTIQNGDHRVISIPTYL